MENDVQLHIAVPPLLLDAILARMGLPFCIFHISGEGVDCFASHVHPLRFRPRPLGGSHACFHVYSRAAQLLELLARYSCLTQSDSGISSTCISV
ncbi:MAG: hypothetical protein ACK56I_06850 [bacterium]